MNEINFLLDGYVSNNTLKKRIIRRCLMFGVVLICMTGVYGVEQSSLTKVKNQIVAMEKELALLKQQSSQVAQLQIKQTHYQNELALRHELITPVTQTQVIATLTELIGQSITISELSLSQDRPEPTETNGSPANQAKSDTSELAGWQYLQIKIKGVAPSGVELANLIGVLEEHVLFENIKVVDSHARVINGLQTRSFKLEMIVLLNRDYLEDRPTADKQTASVGNGA